MIPFHWFVAVLCGWVQRQQDDVIAFLREENRVLKAQLHGRRLRLSDHERRRLATIGHRLGRLGLREVATIATPDTILRWHRELIVRQRTRAGRRGKRPRLDADIRPLVVRMATENATWGYTRIQGALKNLGYHVGRSSIARILKEHSIPPSGQRPMTWRTFVRAHWPALLDFFATEVSTIRGWIMHWAASVMAPVFRGVHEVRSRVRRDELFVVLRSPTGGDQRYWRLRRGLQADLPLVPALERCSGPPARLDRARDCGSQWHLYRGTVMPGSEEECLERFPTRRRSSCVAAYGARCAA